MKTPTASRACAQHPDSEVTPAQEEFNEKDFGRV